jgi:hypothetical protein
MVLWGRIQQRHIDDVQKLRTRIVFVSGFRRPHFGRRPRAHRANPSAVTVRQYFLARNTSTACLVRIGKANDSLDVWHLAPHPCTICTEPAPSSIATNRVVELPAWRTGFRCRGTCARVSDQSASALAISEPPLIESPPQPAAAVRLPSGASPPQRAAVRRSRRERAASLPSARGSSARAWRARRGRQCS